MKSIKQLLQEYKSTSLRDEDGENMAIELQDKASAGEIKDCESEIGEKLPDQLKELLLISNGIVLYGIEIPSIDNLNYDYAYEAFELHNWGNGDFDYITLDGKISFLDRETETLIKVADSLAEWMEKIFLEMKNDDSVAHPDDYRNKKERGLYYPVYQAQLKNISASKKSKRPKETELPKITKKPVSMSTVEKLWLDKEFNRIEGNIVKNNNGFINHEYDKYTTENVKENVDQCRYSFEELVDYVKVNEKSISIYVNELGKIVKGNSSSREFMRGFTILYAIYLKYHQENNDAIFLDFLKQRSIPKVENFLKQLKNIYAGISRQ